MLKHATISRTNRAQQALQFQRQCQQRQQTYSNHHQEQLDQQQLNAHNGLTNGNRQHYQQPESDCDESSSPQAVTTPTKAKCNSDSMIKVFTQALSQDVEYVTLPINTQTKCSQVVKSLLKKYRLKHRDPNLFFLTLERWLRKDGLRQNCTMVLDDEACPLQMQQCCSNPPYNDIKFTLHARPGALVKIFCSDVVPDARYKCLSLSTQTTVEETIELMLHCLNLTSSNSLTSALTTNRTNITHNNHPNLHLHLSGSPGSTSPSSASSNSSTSSGIESEPNCSRLQHHNCHPSTTKNSGLASMQVASTNSACRLNSNSRASSVTSISSSSNSSNVSQGTAEQYCMVIECKDTNYTRTLDSDEYLVGVHQNLLAEAQRLHEESSSESLNRIMTKYSNDDGSSVANGNATSTINTAKSSLNFDQWFFIKLKRRDQHCNINQTIKFTNLRQSTPLPPIPMLSLAHQFAGNNNNANNLQHIVSTTQIEVTCRPSSSLVSTSATDMLETTHRTPPPLPHHLLGQQANSSENQSRAPSPPQFIVFQPPIRPRRRNLSNASSTFGRPMASIGSAGVGLSRRRYDPAQLADDLNKLDVKEAEQAQNGKTTIRAATSLLCGVNHNLESKHPKQQHFEHHHQQQQPQIIQPS